MKKIVKIITALLIGTLLFSTTAFAASPDDLAEVVEFKETQTVHDADYTDLKCSSSKGSVVAHIHYSYTAYWDEGYSGWIDNASFIMINLYVGDYFSNKITPEGQTVYNGSSAYQQFKIDTIDLTLRIYVSVDEWGNVSMWMVEG